jgi:beta-carotene 3-hydroxylase
MNIIIVALTFLAMEFMAWFTHKFVMHGFLWYLHKDHHQVEPGFFEKNDAFRLFIGIGISLYGFAYFVVHEIIIHQRFKLFTRLNNRYVRAIRRAHKIHHKHLGKYQSENFGMLIVPLKYWIDPNTSK